MSSSLDHIKELVSNLDGETGKAILKAIGAMQEEIEMLEFRLKRMEKIKRTTAIFLDESVAELEQKRAAVEEINAKLEDSIKELKATQAQLVEQEKLASLGSLTAGIAHEIKNPLNFVNNFAEVGGELADELAEAIAGGDAEEAQGILEELKANAEQIAKHGKRADSIVKGMMQHAKGGVSQRENVDINEYVEEYSNLAWHGMRAREHGFQAEVKRELGDDVGTAEVLPQELGRVLLNLFNNAFYAVMMPGAGEKPIVTVSTKRLAPNRIEIRVADNGPGIPADIRDKIFEPFFTTKPTGEGTGLGLSLSYDIITKGHEGAMRAEVAPGGGACFVIELPT